MKSMQIKLQPYEQVLYEGFANHFQKYIGITGKLFLTNDRLYFVTHPLNFQRYTLSLHLSDIESITLKNNLKFFTHGLCIHLKSAHTYNFAVWRRKKWKILVESAMQRIVQ
ncbi:MAG TPA: GRAM domain-containing protein [Patescibacteria group bacterium]|nr:GRAM domain-containing protein [Patescibacteria group bacterium]